MIIQEYYRNFENHNRIIDNYISDRTPNKIKNILKISLTLISFSNKPHYAIVDDAVEVSKEFKKEKLVNAVLRNILKNINDIKYEKYIYPKFKTVIDKIILILIIFCLQL